MVPGSPLHTLSLTSDVFFVPYPITFKSEEEIGECSLETVTKLQGLRAPVQRCCSTHLLEAWGPLSAFTTTAGGPRATAAKQLCWPACGAREG